MKAFSFALAVSAAFAHFASPAIAGEASFQGLVSFYSGDLLVRKVPEGKVQWHSLPVGAGGQNIRLSFDPSAAERIYLGIDVAGIVKTVDGGRHWVNGNVGLHGLSNGNYPAADIAIDPSNPKVLYVSWGRSDGGGQDFTGIAKSTDFGESWTWLSSEVCSYASGYLDRKDGGPGLLVDPNDSKRLYCIDQKHGKGAGGVWISDDAGLSWRPSGLTKRQVWTLRFKPGDSKTLYASCLKHELGAGGMMVSRDRGESWSPAGLEALSVRNFDFDSKDPLTIYAVAGLDGFWRSDDGGLSWQERSKGLPLKRKGDKARYFDYLYRALAVDPGKEGHLIVGADPIRAYFESFDRGETWSRMDVQGHAPKGWMLEDYHLGWHTNNIYFHPSIANRLYLCDYFGTWRSDDGGRNWTVNPYGQESSCMVSVLPDCEIKGRLYLGIWDHYLLILNDDPRNPSVERCRGLYRPGKVNKHVSGIVQFKGSPGSLLCVTNSSLPLVSENRGLDWIVAKEGLPEDCQARVGVPALASKKDLVFIPVNDDGVYRSDDRGRTWTRPENRGVPPLKLCSDWSPTQNVFASSDDGGLLALVNKGCLFVSKDKAESWEALQIPADARTVAIAPDGSLFLGSKEKGLWRRHDSGGSWERILEVEEAIQLIAIDPRDSKRILCHTVKDVQGKRIDYGLKFTQDGGASWRELVNDSLPVWRLQGIAFDPFDEGKVYANTYWCGAWSGRL